MKTDNPQMNVLEVDYSRKKQGGGNNSSDKRGSSGISNASNDEVADRFNENQEYLALSSDQNNTLRLKRVKRGHVGNTQGGGNTNGGKGRVG
jgi:hypothetical protein